MAGAREPNAVPRAAEQGVRARLVARTESVFAAEERQGLMLAAKARTVALAVILLWEFASNTDTGLAYAFGFIVIGGFLLLGLLQYVSARQRFHMESLKYVFVAADCALLAVAFSAGKPWASIIEPPAFAMHGSPFTFFFVFLMQSTFSLRPRLVLWCGLCIVLARTGMLLWVLAQPNVFTTFDLAGADTRAAVAAATDVNYVHIPYWAVEVIVTLLVAGGLAVVVGRSRRLVESRSLAERARANLARYFSPNVVDRLSGAGDILGTAREQRVAVMFVDIVDFTGMCEREAPGRVIALLREYHNRLGRAVFDHHGTLDKYLGDGLMATFGTPEPGPHDARNALQCALAMIAALDAWNAERAAAGEEPVRVGIGLHYGPVIAGDIGNERRLEHSVIGDTVNIASRLEQLTRALNTPLVVSGGLVDAIQRENDGGSALIDNLSAAGVKTLRGREAGVPVWTLAEDDQDTPASLR